MTESLKIFVSVGRTRNELQDTFITAIEERLKSEGMAPCTVGRNFFKNKKPLVAVSDLMKECHGAMVIALERLHFPQGTERRGHPDSELLSDVKFPTVWNQTEAAMAYTHGLPMFLIAENGLRSEGFLENNYDWPVHWVDISPLELTTPQFNGALSDWKNDVVKHSKSKFQAELSDKAFLDEKPNIGKSESATKSALFTGVTSVIGILAATIILLVIAANYAPNHFYIILGAVFPIMILGLAFVARVSGLIGAGQMVSLFKLARRESETGSKNIDA